MTPLLRRLNHDQIAPRRGGAVDPETLRAAAGIVEDVHRGGEPALRAHAERLGDLQAGEPVFLDPDDLRQSLRAISPNDRGVLERTAARIAAFAEAQRASLSTVEMCIGGGTVSHRIAPVERAGCYAPGGRFPLPSSALMTAVTARASGVRQVWIASPRPAAVTRAAAAIAGADGLLCAGGAQAIAALAYGCGPIPACDIVVGPGNRWVTAAKQVISADAGIDMLAGPSELLIIADDSADPATIAADLLAQAEHDDDAIPMLIVLDEAVIAHVELALREQLADLSTRATAAAALRNGFVVRARDLDEALAHSDRIAPEHVQLSIRDAEEVAPRLRHYGALFIGEKSAEVFGDYGAGPNHVLPTGGTARIRAGLSVMTFLRFQTQLRIDDRAGAREIIDDAIALARMEGLEGHARSAERRRC